jgi:hypothetical protein
VGPGAEEAVNTLDAELTDLSSEVEGLRTEFDDLNAAFHELCSAIGSAYIDANSATEDMLFELDLACP